MIRIANLSDLDALVQLELRCFTSERLSRRSFRHLLTRGHAQLLVETVRGRLRGYALLNLRAGSRKARIYSFAVDPEHRQHGIGRALLKAVELAAQRCGAASVHLEVRSRNRAAQQLYKRLGYQVIGRWLEYYADHEDALRMEKSLNTVYPGRDLRVNHNLLTAA